jgi:hypothetical protein
MGSIALVLVFLVYTNYIYMLGFPDGFITELGYAQRRLAYIFIAVSIVFAAYFFYLGPVASQKEISRLLSVAAALYSLVIAGVVLINFYYRLEFTG